MPEPRTIDNLGVETSVRWASDQKFLEETPLNIKEARPVSDQVEIQVTLPAQSSKFEDLLGIENRCRPWADFFPPEGYNSQKKLLFTHQVIPSLGTEEFQQTQIQKIKDFLSVKREEEGDAPHKTEYAWEDEQREQKNRKESKILIDLIEYIQGLDALLGMINSRRIQYSKG